MKSENAAGNLTGRTLKNDWKVIEKIEPKEGSSGGFFSVCYLVEKDGEKAFLKALDFRAFFQIFGGPGKSIIDVIGEQTKAYQFEKELLARCKSSRLSKVSMIIDEGEEFLKDYVISNVPYMIFEIADGDVRSHMNFSKSVDNVWKLHSLHDVAVGLRQLHKIEIGHQDLKPSNVLLYENSIVSKIGDLGRSLCSDIEAPHENGSQFTGDFTYAPPEFLYGYQEPDLNTRMMSTDMYLFGSLIVYYFSGLNMTALIGKNINPDFKWSKWKGSFEEVKDYLINGFDESIKDLKKCIPNESLATELAEVVKYCCYPYPQERGHEKTLRERGNQYDFQRVISKMDYLSKKASYQFN